MKELRDIKIDMLTGSKNPVLDLFNQITDGIKIVNCDVYNKEGREFIYHKDGEWIFYQDLKNEKFWCNYYKYWSFFESQFGLKYGEVQAITKYLVEEALKREVVTPMMNNFAHTYLVEEALKREVVTPNLHFLNTNRLVEEALQREVVTPTFPRLTTSLSVEEALKREVVTPSMKKMLVTGVVEEALKRETK